MGLEGFFLCRGVIVVNTGVEGVPTPSCAWHHKNARRPCNQKGNRSRQHEGGRETETDIERCNENKNK